MQNNSAFAGVVSGPGNPNQVDSHPGPCFSAWCIDGHPMNGGDGNDGGMAATTASPLVLCSSAHPCGSIVTGQLYKIGGANTNLHRKLFPTFAYNGMHALVDVSGPSSASTFGSTSANAYEYCVVLIAGECVAGSVVGNLYVNTPFASNLYCPATSEDGDQSDDINMICIGDLGSDIEQLVQTGVLIEDDFGALTRRLGSGLNRWNRQYSYWNWTITPNGVVGNAYTRWLDNIRTEVLKTVVPQYPTIDGINRQTYEPLIVTLTAPTGTATAQVQFGYGENGSASGYYCTSRQEACNAVLGTVNQTTPFYFSSETYTRESCASGCTVAIPALPQHVAYWQAMFYNSGGTLIATGPQNATTVY